MDGGTKVDEKRDFHLTVNIIGQVILVVVTCYIMAVSKK